MKAEHAHHTALLNVVQLDLNKLPLLLVRSVRDIAVRPHLSIKYTEFCELHTSHV
jgi:hypothetical protein